MDGGGREDARLPLKEKGARFMGDKREMQPPDPKSGKMQQKQQPVVWRRELEGRTAAGEEEEGKMLPRLSCSVLDASAAAELPSFF